MLHVPLHEEDVVSLVGRAHARRRFPELQFADPEAEAVLSRVEVDPHQFAAARLRAAAVQTIAIDHIVRAFFRRHPDGLGVALYPGLCTRFSRVDNGTLRWVDLDRPGVAEVKHRLYSTPDRHVVATCRSLTCRCWMAPLRLSGGMPVLIVSQGALRRCPAAELELFLLRSSEELPTGTELVLDHDANRPLLPSSRAGGACLSVRGPDGSIARYPRFRFAADPAPTSSVAHLRVA